MISKQLVAYSDTNGLFPKYQSAYRLHTYLDTIGLSEVSICLLGCTLTSAQLVSIRSINLPIWLHSYLDTIGLSEVTICLSGCTLTSTQLVYPKYQSAYRTAHSTKTTFTAVLSELIQEMDAGDITLLSLLDLSAAFDCVDHEILLNRLRITYGLESTVINWFASYLSDRTQRVHRDGQFSARSTMRFGVPQGSVLGPLMFLLYTANIEHLMAHRGLSPRLYADDAQMFICCRPGNTHLLRDSTQSCITNIEEWMCSNLTKSKFSKNRVLVVDHTLETPSH